MQRLLSEILLLYSFVLHFPTFNFCYVHCHSVDVLQSDLIICSFLFFFTPFALYRLFFLFLLFLSVCVAGICLGSSPTSSQSEALPPSTDWPVSAYTSSFSLSSPEMDDAGTWFKYTPTPPSLLHIAVTKSLQILLLGNLWLGAQKQTFLLLHPGHCT